MKATVLPISTFDARRSAASGPWKGEDFNIGLRIALKDEWREDVAEVAELLRNGLSAPSTGLACSESMVVEVVSSLAGVRVSQVPGTMLLLPVWVSVVASAFTVAGCQSPDAILMIVGLIFGD